MELLRTVCNSYSVNTYILAAENLDAVLIDPACCNEQECARIVEVVHEKKYRIVSIFITHPHADHVMGSRLIKDAFSEASFLMHEEGVSLYEQVNDYSMLMGFRKIENLPQPTAFLTDGEEIKLGNLTLKIFHTPGHAPGSVCIYSPERKIVFTGDVLFQNSIGRTDLQGGNFDILKEMILRKLFVLPDETIVLPGHGDRTTIGHEKQFNPFL